MPLTRTLVARPDSSQRRTREGLAGASGVPFWSSIGTVVWLLDPFLVGMAWVLELDCKSLVMATGSGVFACGRSLANVSARICRAGDWEIIPGCFQRSGT